MADAVERVEGRGCVLRGDDIDTDIGSAVQASSAVPGWFAPVEVDGRRLVDGPAWLLERPFAIWSNQWPHVS